MSEYTPSAANLALHAEWLNRIKAAAKDMPSSVGMTVLQTLMAAAIVGSKADLERTLEGIRRIVAVLRKAKP